MIWLFLLIPLIGCAVSYHLWTYRFVWWELLIPTFISFIFILISKFAVEKSITNDTQYLGGMITEARYYEYWSSWVEQTCSYECNCSTDKDGHETCQTCYKDCSYCSKHQPYWEVYDNQGHHWEVEQSEYNRLMKQWNATPEFVELNRNIHTHFSCGEDGNMYRIKWDGKPFTSETSTWDETYHNKTQAARTNFDLKKISIERAQKLGLYNYPKLKEYYQNNIMGIDSLKYLSLSEKYYGKKIFNYFNGLYGPQRKLRLYVLLFFDKPISIANDQKNYWDGGNKNEMVVCIGMNKNTGEISWVFPFSWTENKRVAVDLREDINNIKYLNFDTLYKVIDKSTEKFTYRDFDQFNYIQVEPPTWELWMVFIVTVLITIGVLWFGYENEFVNEEYNTKGKTITINKKFFVDKWNELIRKFKNWKDGL